MKKPADEKQSRLIARLTGEVVKTYCPECNEFAQFVFTDSQKTFTIGLTALIKMILVTDTNNALGEWRKDLKDKYIILREDLWLRSNLRRAEKRARMI